MTHQSEPRRGRLLSGLISRKVRAMLCLGIFAAPAAVGTMAYWTADATIPTGTLTAGTLDLTVGGTVEDSKHLPGPGGTHLYSALTIGNLVPGESIARPFVVRNFGTTGFTYNGSVTTVDDDLVNEAGGLRVQLYPNSTFSNTGAELAGNRVGTCSGTPVYDEAVSTTSITPVYPLTDPLLSAGTTQTYCVRITLDAYAPNALQGKSTSIVFHLNAKQVGAP